MRARSAQPVPEALSFAPRPSPVLSRWAVITIASRRRAPDDGDEVAQLDVPAAGDPVAGTAPSGARSRRARTARRPSSPRRGCPPSPVTGPGSPARAHVRAAPRSRASKDGGSGGRRQRLRASDGERREQERQRDEQPRAAHHARVDRPLDRAAAWTRAVGVRSAGRGPWHGQCRRVRGRLYSFGDGRQSDDPAGRRRGVRAEAAHVSRSSATASRVVHARDGEEALARFAEEEIDLVVLDLMLPRLDGLEVCKRLRAESTVPIIMLTARDDELDKVLGLELGADDYITKPFSIREFRSRVRALLRRAAAPRPGERQDDEVVELGELRIDVPRRTVVVRGEEVQLTFVEFELLRVLGVGAWPCLLAPPAARAPARWSRLSRAAHDRRPRPASPREDRERPARAGADPHRAGRRLPVPGALRMSALRRRSGHPASARARAAARRRRRARRRLPDRRPLAGAGARQRQARPARAARSNGCGGLRRRHRDPAGVRGGRRPSARMHASSSTRS